MNMKKKMSIMLVTVFLLVVISFTLTLPIYSSNMRMSSPTSEILIEIHDVAVIDLTASPTKPSPGQLVSINVTVENQGDYTETFDVSVYYTLMFDPLIGTQTVTDLLRGENRTLTFEWLPPRGWRIEIRAEAILIDDIDPVDNTRTIYILARARNPESSNQTILAREHAFQVAFGILGFLSLSVFTKTRPKNLKRRQKEYDELLDEFSNKHL